MWQKLISPAVNSPLDFMCLFVEYDSEGNVKQIYKTSSVSEELNTERFLVRSKKAAFLISVTVQQYWATALLTTHKNMVVTNL